MVGSADRGFSLVEILIGFTLLSLLALFSVGFLSQGQRLWRRVESSSSAAQSLSKASQTLNADLINIGRTGVATTSYGTMGQAVWFLSAYDPDTKTFVRNGGGRSFWQKNVLYYLTVPLDHDSRFGVHCADQDLVCPHKILLRKVIDTGAPTSPASVEADEETLASSAEISVYLTQPATLDLAGLAAEPGVVSVDYVAGYLLDMAVTLSSQGLNVSEAEVVLRAGLINDAKAHLKVGTDPFNKGTFTLSREIDVVPRN